MSLSDRSKATFANAPQARAPANAANEGRIIAAHGRHYTVELADGSPVSYTHLTLPTILLV